MNHDYLPPVSHLLSYDAPQFVKPEAWPDYLDEFGFTAEHIPELLKLMADTALAEIDPDQPPLLPADVNPAHVWGAPIHALRSLAQLQAVDLFDHAVDLINSELDEWAGEELISIIQIMGEPVLAPVTRLLETHITTEDRILPLIEGLYTLPAHHADTRDRVVAILMSLLENYAENDIDNNSFLAVGLLELKATESANLLEQAYAAEQIDEFVTGTWPYAQVELGLKSEADFTEAELTAKLPPGLLQMQEMYEAVQRRRKPDAFSLGLPMDPSAFSSTKPPEFDDMLGDRKKAAPKTEKGFGSDTPPAKKSKKGKKKR